MNPRPVRVSCDLIVVTYNHLDDTRRCLESIIHNTDVSYRLIIIDNASRSETIDYLQQFRSQHPHVELILNQCNNGWVRAVNQGIRLSSAPYLCWMNNDTVVTSGWLSALLEVAMAHPDIGLVNPSWSAQGEALEVFQERARKTSHPTTLYRELNECNGACMLVKRTVVEQIGLLDEVFETGGLDDADFSRRATRAGVLCVQATRSFVYHRQNVSVNAMPGYWQRERVEKQRIFEARWGQRRQIIVIFDEEGIRAWGVPQHIAEMLRGLARLGIGIHVWILSSRTGPLNSPNPPAWLADVYGIAHNNIKIRLLKLPGWFPRKLQRIFAMLWCVGLLASRRNKHETKQYKAVIVGAHDLARAFRASQWLHRVGVYASLAQCPSVARELGWLFTLMPRRETLSVVVITKNESHQIVACLNTVTWVDEIVVVDDCSTDETPDLCRQFAARVVKQKSEGNFDRQRNLGIDQASGHWVIQMDADERVPETLRLEIEMLLRTYPQANGFVIQRINWFLGHRVQFGGWNDSGLKLFRRAAGRYIGCSVHETLQLNGVTGQCSAPIEHYPYRNLSQVIERTNFYSSVQASIMSKQEQTRTMKDFRYHLGFRPVKIFWKIFVKKQAFRDGFIGFLFSVLFSWSYWLEWVKRWEHVQPVNQSSH